MDFFERIRHQKWLQYTIATCSAVLLYFILTNLSVVGSWIAGFFGIIKPILLAIIIAYTMDPLSRHFENGIFKRMKNRKLARQISIVLDILIVLLCFVLLIWALIPQILQSLVAFLESNYTNTLTLENNLSSLNETLFAGKMDVETLALLIESIISKLMDTVSTYSGKIISRSTEYLSSFLTFGIAFILGIYFMFDKEHIMEWIKKILKVFMKDKYDSFENFCYRCNRILVRYIECDLIDALFVGCANFLFMTILGMPYAALISVVVGVTNLAPTFGPIVGGFIGTFFLAMIRPGYALIFLIFTIILQTIDGYIIKPKLFGSTLGVSSLWILIAIVIGGRMLGVLGILLAIPFAAIVQYVLKEILWPQENIQEFLEGNR